MSNVTQIGEDVVTTCKYFFMPVSETRLSCRQFSRSSHLVNSSVYNSSIDFRENFRDGLVAYIRLHVQGQPGGRTWCLYEVFFSFFLLK